MKSLYGHQVLFFIRVIAESGVSRVPLCSAGFLWVLLGSYRFYWVPMGFPGFQAILPDPKRTGSAGADLDRPGQTRADAERPGVLMSSKQFCQTSELMAVEYALAAQSLKTFGLY